MTKNEFKKMFGLFAYVVARGHEDVLSYAPSAHLIDNCGGYELELHPSQLMWDREITCLCSMADMMTHSVECRFYDGTIIIR